MKHIVVDPQIIMLTGIALACPWSLNPSLFIKNVSLGPFDAGFAGQQ